MEGGERIPKAKFRLPARPGSRVARERLTTLLSAGTARVTTLTAPAGYGKSALMAEWHLTAHVRARRFAMVSLERGDNDPARFWSVVAEAFGRLGARLPPETAPRLSAELRALDGPPGSFLAVLLEALEDTPQRGILVLDDTHVVEDPAIRDGLGRLVAGLPPTVHLVLISRTAIEDLPLHRVRLQGGLQELGVRELAFTPEEAHAFLAARGPAELPEGRRRLLVEESDGWIAGLQLATLAQGATGEGAVPAASLAGRSRGVSEFLLHEVLDLQTPEVRRFLVETSVLEVLSAPLCDAVTGRGDSGVLLHRLAADGLFVLPLAEGEHLYRYQGLFADFLSSQVELLDRERVLELHRRASTWLEAEGDPVGAVEHALSGRDHERAASLIVGLVFDMHRRGLDQTLHRWFAALPPDVLARRPALALRHAWILVYGGRPAEALHWCERADDRAAGDVAVLTESACLRAFASRMLGDLEATVGWGRRGLALLEAREPRHRQQDAFARLAMTDAMATAQELLGEPEAALRLLADSGVRTQEGGNVFAAVALPGMMAAISSTLGRFEDVVGHVDRALEAADRLGMAGQPTTADALVALGELRWERDDLAGAEECFLAAAEVTRRSHRVWMHVRALLGLAGCQASQRRGEEAEALLESTAAAHRSGAAPAYLRARIAERQLRVGVRLGHLEHAAEWTRTLEAGTPAPALLAHLEAEVLLASGEVAPALARAERSAAGPGQGREAIERHVLLARCAAAAGERRASLRALAAAVAAGEPHRFVRTLAEPAAGLLSSFSRPLAAGVDAHGAPDGEYLRLLDAAARTELGRSAPTHAERPQRPPLREPLSDGELAVIRFLPTERTYAEIASTRYVSVNTIKSQLKSIYRKLGATSRVTAVERCRELGLLAGPAITRVGDDPTPGSSEDGAVITARLHHSGRA